MTLLHDARYAVRLFRREPAFASVAVLTMALGIGAATTLFSVAYGVLMKPLPWPDAGRVMRITEMRKGQQGRIRGTITNGSYIAWRASASTVEAIGAYSVVPAAMTLSRGNGEPARVQVGRATASLFAALGVPPVRGRVFTDAETPSGFGGNPADPTGIVLSYALWQEWYGGRDDAVGSVVRADDLSLTIIGVMPREFAFPDRETRAWLPMPIGSFMTDRGFQRMMIFGALARLKAGVSPQQAAAEGTARARTAPDPGFTAVALFGSTAPPDLVVTPAAEAMTAEVRPALEILLAAVALLLATATANVGSLQLARAATRQREIAVRSALGAGRVRIARQLIVESGVLGAAGAVGGLALAAALHRALPVVLPADFPRAADISIDPHVLAFALAIVFVTSVACGLMPAAPLVRVDVAEALAEDNAASAAGAWRSRGARWRAAVMTAQIAVACVLLVGAVLLGRSLVALLHADRGYDPNQVLTARVDLPRRYEGAARASFADRVLERIRSSPRVAHAAAGNALPFVSGGGNFGFKMPSPSNPSVTLQVQTLVRAVSPEYFQTLRLRLVAGRLLSDADAADARPVIVVNRSFAQRYLGSSPLGARVPLPFGEGRSDCDVVGIVEDMRQGDVTEPQAAEVFASYRQMAARLVSGPLLFVVRTDDDPASHAAALRTAVREQDPSVAIDSIVSLDERLLTSLAKPRMYAALLAGFAIAALAIASVGLFGVLSYSVAQRSREIGIRTALGAQRGDVIALVLRQAMAVALAGVAAGLFASVAASAYLAAFLYGVAAHDPASFVAVGAAVVIVAAIASIVPARRAAAVDPVVALKG